MKKLSAIGMAFILLIGILSACSSKDTSTEPGEGPVKLTLWHPEGDTTEAYEEIIKGFNKEHEGEIEAEITFIPRGNKYAYEDKISAAATSDTLPDLLSLDGPNVAN